MKKLLILLLTGACALCLAFAVAGCKPDGGESSGGTNTQQGETGGSEETGGGSEETDGEHVHNYGDLIPEKPATCAEEGLQAHYYCEGCQTYFDGEKQEIKFKDLTIPAGHILEENQLVCKTCNEQLAASLSFGAVYGAGTSYVWSGTPTSDGKIMIPKIYNGLPVTSIDDEAFRDCKSLESITIPDSVTSIGSSAFEDCTNLISITIPNSVTSIGSSAFYDCKSLERVTIGNSVTSIGYYAFHGCKSLESITVSEGNATYASQDGILYNKEKTKFIHIPQAIKGAVIPDEITSIGDGAFYKCTNLESVTIPDSVTSIGIGAFEDCTSLESITLPDSVTSIGERAFYFCTSLTSVTIGNGVTTIGSDAIYYGCTSLESITVSENNTEYASQDGILYNKEKTEFIHIPIAIKGSVTIPDRVTSIGYRAFSGCYNLTSITIPDSVTSIGSDAFSGCYRLYEVINLSDLSIEKGEDTCGGIAKYALNVVNSPEQSKIKYLQDYLYYEDGDTVHLLGYKGNNTELQLPEKFGEKTYGIYDYAFYNNDKIIKVTIPDSVTSIGEYAFYNCTNLTSVTIGNGVTSIGYRAFQDCKNLESVTIGNGVTSIGSDAFKDCTSLESITVSEGNATYASQDGILYNKNKTKIIFVPNAIKGAVTIPDGVTSIGYNTFSYCESLESITIPDSVTSIGDGAFNNCTSLSSVTIPNGVTSIGKYMFADCKSLTSITIPNSVTSIGDEAFRDCKSLESITIPDGVTSIGYRAFKGCKAEIKWGDNPSIKEIGGAFEGWLGTSITIPNSVTSIGYRAFSGCTNLTSVTIPESVTSIRDMAFQDCKNLESVTIGNGVTSIGSNAFQDCTSLTSVTIGNGVTSIGNRAFYNCKCLESVTVGNGVTSIGNDAFYNCHKLESVYITDIVAWCNIDFSINIANPLYYAHNLYLDNQPVTELTAEMLQGVTTIKDWAFSGCTNLTSITIPESVTSIGNGAFAYCSKLNSVTFANPNGWYCTKDSSATSGTDIKSEDLQKPGTAAQYLRGTYYNYYWKRKTA